MDNEILAVLNEINTTLKSAGSAWLPAAFALAGALGGATVVGYWQHKSSKLNVDSQEKSHELGIRAELISKQRQEWMDKIRDTCKVFLSEYDVLISNIEDKSLTQEDINRLYKSASENGSLIILMLNPEKKLQKKVIDIIHDIQNVLGLEDQSKIDGEYDRLRDDLLDSLSKVFRVTWRKIKKVK